MKQIYKNSWTWKDSEGDDVICGVIPPEVHTDNADDAIEGLIGDYNTESSRNPLPWRDFNAEPVISVKYQEINPRELAEILSIERGIEQGTAYTVADSMYGLLMAYWQR
ncbi:MAG: hypothetical protein AABX24_04895 [Nanoarchaeota archaeon]